MRATRHGENKPSKEVARLHSQVGYFSVHDAHSLIDNDFIGEDESFAIEGESIQFYHDRFHLLNVANGCTSALGCGNRCGTLCPVPLVAWRHCDLECAGLLFLGQARSNGSSVRAILKDCFTGARDLGWRRKWQRRRLDEITVIVVIIDVVIEADARSEGRWCRCGESWL